MENEMIIELKSLEPYRHLFPKAVLTDTTVKMGASVSDTVEFIPEVVRKTAWQVKDFVQEELSYLPFEEACKKLWWWVKEHIRYQKDDRGKEQVRSPRRLIHDGHGDCDCMTVFIHCCLHHMGAKMVGRRITEYDHLGYFQHIYSIVPYNGKKIIMDTVWNDYDTEKQYTKKEDYTMDLQFLDGIGETTGSLSGVDAQDLFGSSNEMSELGKLLKRRSGTEAGAKKTIFKNPILPKRTVEQKAQAKEKRKVLGKKVLKVVNKVNKINPATLMLRAGILAYMKLNLMKIAEKIKWGYATPEYASSKGMDMTKYDKLKQILAKTKQIFYAAGGKPENLKHAILTGRGNSSHEVSGIDGYTSQTKLSELLGAIYKSEFMEGMEGFSGFDALAGSQGLGEPATAASIAAASTAMGTLAALLKSLGELFPKKKVNEQTSQSENTDTPTEQNTQEESEQTNQQGGEQASEQTSELTKEQSSSEDEQSSDQDSPENPSQESSSEVSVNDESGSESNANEEGTNGLLSSPLSGVKDFYQKNKNWIVPVGVAVSVGALVMMVNHYSNTEDEEKPLPKRNPQTLNGQNRSSSHTKGWHKHKHKHKAQHTGYRHKPKVIPLA